LCERLTTDVSTLATPDFGVVPVAPEFVRERSTISVRNFIFPGV